MTGPVLRPPIRREPEEVVAWIRTEGAAVVAMSGGVDSSLVASLAFSALADRAVAVTLTGPAVAASEVERAGTVARTIGIRHVELPVDPLGRPEYRANGPDRCYHCRSVETESLRAFGSRNGSEQYLDGIHVDDLADDRPGLRAMEEARFRHPLLWAGWGKRYVREEARRRGLPNWDLPSDACLASRVFRGEAITPELLRRVEAAESLVRELGFRRVRVRVRAGGARVEVDPAEVDRLRVEPEASELTARIARLGFDPVVLDPRGYRGGGGSLPVLP